MDLLNQKENVNHVTEPVNNVLVQLFTNVSNVTIIIIYITVCVSYLVQKDSMVMVWFIQMSVHHVNLLVLLVS